MTPKLSGALESLRQLKSYAEDEAVKLTKRIEQEAKPALIDGFKVAHGAVDGMHRVVDDIVDFANELKTTNGGDPLDSSTVQSGSGATPDTGPRSSEVAQK